MRDWPEPDQDTWLEFLDLPEPDEDLLGCPITDEPEPYEYDFTEYKPKNHESEYDRKKREIRDREERKSVLVQRKLEIIQLAKRWMFDLMCDLWNCGIEFDSNKTWFETTYKRAIHRFALEREVSVCSKCGDLSQYCPYCNTCAKCSDSGVKKESGAGKMFKPPKCWIKVCLNDCHTCAGNRYDQPRTDYTCHNFYFTCYNTYRVDMPDTHKITMKDITLESEEYDIDVKREQQLTTAYEVVQFAKEWMCDLWNCGIEFYDEFYEPYEANAYNNTYDRAIRRFAKERNVVLCDCVYLSYLPDKDSFCPSCGSCAKCSGTGVRCDSNSSVLYSCCRF